MDTTKNMSETNVAPSFSKDAQVRLQSVAAQLLAARRGKALIELPANLKPGTLEEAYFIQDRMAAAQGKICGWKVGGPIGTTPLCGPMPQAGFTADGGILANPNQRLRGVEAEIAFLVGKDLPQRAVPYTREEVKDAMASCHPAIEELEAAYASIDGLDRFSMIADLISNGGFVVGPAFTGWRGFDFAQESVKVSVNGVVRVEAKASNPGGTDLTRFLLWLANDAAWRTGGLKKGQWITTGSWMGKVLADAGSTAKVEFQHAGSVSIRFN
jgi:2-keto-4-pentenoate hydratase